MKDISEIGKVLEDESYDSRRETLEKIRTRLIGEIDNVKNNAEYIALLLTLELELRKDNEAISSEQRLYYKKYSQYWTDREKDLWKVNYAGFVFDQKRGNCCVRGNKRRMEG